jgi:hypothetical protein
MVEVPDDPGFIENAVGFAERVKVGGGIVMDTVTECDTCIPLITVVALTVTV